MRLNRKPPFFFAIETGNCFLLKINTLCIAVFFLIFCYNQCLIYSVRPDFQIVPSAPGLQQLQHVLLGSKYGKSLEAVLPFVTSLFSDVQCNIIWKIEFGIKSKDDRLAKMISKQYLYIC